MKKDLVDEMASEVAVAERVEAVIQQMSTIFIDMDGQRSEESYLVQEKEYLQNEVSRVQSLLQQAETDLTETTKTAEEMAQQRDAALREQPPDELYAELSELIEKNTRASLEVQALELQLEETLKAAHRMMEETGSLERDNAQVQSYIERLREATQEQDLLIDRRQAAIEQLRVGEDTVVSQEREILALRQEMMRCDLEIPVAPMTHRTNRSMKARGTDVPQSYLRPNVTKSGQLVVDGASNSGRSADSLILSTETVAADATAVNHNYNSKDGARRVGGISADGLVVGSSGTQTIGKRISLAVGVLRILSDEFGMSVREKAKQLGVTDLTIATDSAHTLLTVSGPAAFVMRFEQAVANALRDDQARDGLHTYKSNERAVCYDVALERLRQLLVHMSPKKKRSEVPTGGNGGKGSVKFSSDLETPQ